MVITGLAVGIGRVSVGEISSNQMKCNLDGGQTRGGAVLRELEQASVFSEGNVRSC